MRQRIVPEHGGRDHVVSRHVRTEEDLHLGGHAVVENRDAVARVPVPEGRPFHGIEHVLTADPDGVTAAPAGSQEAQEPFTCGRLRLRSFARAPPVTVLAPTSEIRGAVFLNAFTAFEK